MDAGAYEFGSFALDRRTFELRRCGERVPIERLAYDFLVYLIRNRDRVVAPQELLEELWPAAVVTRAALARAAYLARAAIGDDASRPVWIATLHRRGYRFVGAVRERNIDDACLSPWAPALARLHRRNSTRYTRALELLDLGSLALLRRELLSGLADALDGMGEQERSACVLREAARASEPSEARRTSGRRPRDDLKLKVNRVDYRPGAAGAK